MEKTWKPTVGGIFCLLGGVPSLIFGLMSLSMGTFAGGLFMEWFGGMGALFLVLGIIAIIGGVFALKRTRWGLALVGAICSMTILAIIFVALSKKEFA